jgi:EAL domain-containing protein (putative c-di-GMP-specific phosphodiesterase class I)/GGDEF domain-containing protein
MSATPVPVRIAANRPGRPALVSPGASWSDAERQFHANVSNGLENPSSGLGVFVVDLPGLLEIAETYGDRARHALLQKIEWRLRSLFGPGAVARTAVMRFSLMLQGVLEQDIPSIVERIQAAVCGRQSSIGSGVVIVGLPTVGVALTGKLDGRIRGQAAIVADLIRHAELALQQAVADRPGTYRLYSAAMDAALRDRTLLRQALLRAIDRQEFRLAYQPIVDLQTQATVGLEALIRWHTPPLGISADPGTFIQAAEDTGLIVPIGTQVLTMAALQMRRWMHRGFPPPRVAVNVSGLQLRDANFAALVQKTLDAAGLPPSCLELELTERTLVDSSANTIRMLEAMRKTGIEFAVDDFGTGYSSLRYLQELPIAKLKIDRSFITPIAAGGRQVALVDAMLGLAANLGLKVVAEGIETEEQLGILRSKGCQNGQGYLFSPALPAEDAHHCFKQSWDVA